MDYEDNRLVYELEFYTADGKWYWYDIDGAGVVTEWEYDAEKYAAYQAMEKQFEEIKTAALKAAGLAAKNVIWGELDYLLVDMPPGTGDVPLTVFQSLPVDGIVIVTSPQDLVKMIVKKAFNMAATMNIPVLGMIENYSYLKCPDCGKEISVFGKSRIEEVSKELQVAVLGKMPIDPRLTELSDAGEFAQAVNPYLDGAFAALQLLNVKAKD